jgi:hypothetical protein
MWMDGPSSLPGVNGLLKGVLGVDLLAHNAGAPEVLLHAEGLWADVGAIPAPNARHFVHKDLCTMLDFYPLFPFFLLIFIYP